MKRIDKGFVTLLYMRLYICKKISCEGHLYKNLFLNSNKANTIMMCIQYKYWYVFILLFFSVA